SPGGCSTVALPIGTPGAFFASGVATDPDRGVVYVSTSPGAGNATVFHYTVAANTAQIYVTTGRQPFFADDPTAGARSMRGHLWVVARTDSLLHFDVAAADADIVEHAPRVERRVRAARIDHQPEAVERALAKMGIARVAHIESRRPGALHAKAS